MLPIRMTTSIHSQSASRPRSPDAMLPILKMDTPTKIPAPHTLDRQPYFWWGCALMAIKYNLDRAIALVGFNRSWYFWNYIKPNGFAAIDALPPDDKKFYFILLITSLPFLIAGIFLTLRRLRSAGLPLALCLLFFVPVINLIFFVVLCLVPAKPAAPVHQVVPRDPPTTPAGEQLLNEWLEGPAKGPPVIKPAWASWIPASAAGSALAAMVIVGLAGTGLACLSTTILQSYGWGLFVALPFAMGLVSVLIYTISDERTFESCIAVAVLPVMFAGLLFFSLAAEGAICILMAAPIGIALAVLGGFVGCIIVHNRTIPLSPVAMGLILASVPFTMGMEKRAVDQPPLMSVTSSVVIDAPPEKVWPNVVSFTTIPEQRDWILHTGVAYPIRARIDGHGVGAIRHCIFTTGEFVEPIEVWDDNHLLRFSVAAQPEPMEELSPYPRVKPAHPHGYLLSREGELRLTPLPSGKTLLEGTTWYTDRIWPSRYWQLWSNTIIHHIHLRVLNHIKDLSEARPLASSQ
jgi:uncharacterized membrane protein YhaH (DUF805 family)